MVHHAAWDHCSLAFIHDVARCLALTRQGEVCLNRQMRLRKKSIQVLMRQTCFGSDHPAPRNEHEAPAHSFLFGLLIRAGLIDVNEETACVTERAYKWLGQPAELQLYDLRQTWFLALETGWRWLPADRRKLSLASHWQYVVLEAVRPLHLLPTTIWTPMLDVVAELEGRGVLALGGVAQNLPRVRRSVAQRTQGVLLFLFQEILPRLGLIETHNQDGFLHLRPTSEGVAWLHTALVLRDHVTHPPHETAVEQEVPFRELRFPPLDEPPVTVDDDLRLTVGLAAPAACTFEVAHFAQLLSPGPPARYQITQSSLEQAAVWGYSGADVIVLLTRFTCARLPPGAITRLVAWQQEVALVSSEPGYRLGFAHPAVMDTLRRRRPFRERTQPLASGQDVWVNQAQADDLFRYLRRLGYVLNLSEEVSSEDSLLWSVRHQVLPLRQMLVVLRTYQHVRQLVPGLADLGLEDLDQVLAGALAPDDQAAVQRLVESHIALLTQGLESTAEESEGEGRSGRRGGGEQGDRGAEEQGSKGAKGRGGKGEVLSPASRHPCSSAQIQAAVEAGTRLHITYVDAQARLTRRRVQPLRLEERWGRRYLVARCDLRQDERWFRVDRIIAVR